MLDMFGIIEIVIEGIKMQTKNCSVVISDEYIEFKDVPVNRLFVSINSQLMIKVSEHESIRLRDSQIVDFSTQWDNFSKVDFNRMSEPVNLAEYRE